MGPQVFLLIHLLPAQSPVQQLPKLSHRPPQTDYSFQPTKQIPTYLSSSSTLPSVRTIKPPPFLSARIQDISALGPSASGVLTIQIEPSFPVTCAIVSSARLRSLSMPRFLFQNNPSMPSPHIQASPSDNPQPAQTVTQPIG